MTDKESSESKVTSDESEQIEDIQENQSMLLESSESTSTQSADAIEISELNDSDNKSTQTKIEIEVIDIDEENKKINTRIEDIYSDLKQKNKNLEDLEPKIEFLTQALENISEWNAGIENSFASKFFTRLSNAKSRLDADELLVRDWIDSDIEIDINFVKNARNWFVKRFLISLLAIGSVTLLIYFLNSVNTIEYRELLNYLGISTVQIYIYSWFIYALYLSRLIFSYSRKWSRHRRDLTVALARSQAIIDALDNIKQAKNRIDSLHPQIRQYLEILSLAIHTPWRVPNEFLNFESDTPDTEFFPEGFDVASPNLSASDPKFTKLVDKAASQFYARTWRFQALENLIKKISNYTGAKLDIGELDRDARKNGLRKLILNTHTESMAGLNEILYDLARDEIRNIVPSIQTSSFNELLVSSIKTDPLDGLDLGDDLVAEPIDKVPWDGFLGVISGPCAPWSQLVFSKHGILKDKHEKVNRSFLLGVERFSDKESADMAFIPSSNKATRPVDLLLRVDLSDWCSAGEVSIFEGMEISETEEDLENTLEENSISTDGAAI